MNSMSSQDHSFGDWPFEVDVLDFGLDFDNDVLQLDFSEIAGDTDPLNCVPNQHVDENMVPQLIDFPGANEPSWMNDDPEFSIFLRGAADVAIFTTPTEETATIDPTLLNDGINIIVNNEVIIEDPHAGFNGNMNVKESAYPDCLPNPVAYFKDTSDVTSARNGADVESNNSDLSAAQEIIKAMFNREGVFKCIFHEHDAQAFKACAKIRSVYWADIK